MYLREQCSVMGAKLYNDWSAATVFRWTVSSLSTRNNGSHESPISHPRKKR